MKEIVKAIHLMQRKIEGSAISLAFVKGRLKITNKRKAVWFDVVHLYRPSSRDVVKAASPHVFLILSEATAKAAQAAAPYNHVVLPNGSFRLVAPGIAIVREDVPPIITKPRTTKLAHRTGVIAETLLLGGKRAWSLEELAKAAQVSVALAHRAVTRLETEGILQADLAGARKTRQLINPSLLAEIWSDEEEFPRPRMRGYLYGNSIEKVAQRILQICPDGAMGGAFAANQYCPILTRMPVPIQVWAPENFAMHEFLEAGLEETAEGVNIEILQDKKDSWKIHASRLEPATVSKWRAWVEIANATGRAKELADMLMANLLKET